MKFDVLVIGAGAMGGAAAYHLAKSGAKVCVFDQFTVPHDKGSSHAETRLIRQAYFENPNYVPLLKRAYELWDELAENSDQLFVRNGLFVAGRQDRKIMQGILHSAKQHEIPVEVLSATDAKRNFPNFNFENHEICILEKNAGYLLVDNCLRAHLQKAEHFGATILQQTCIDSFTKAAGEFSVKTGGREFKAKKVIVCAGAWAANMLPEKYKAALTAYRVPLFWFPPLQEFTPQHNESCFAFDLEEGFFYGFPQLSLDGMKVGLHKPGLEIHNPSAFNRELKNDERAPVQAFVKAKIPNYQPNISKEATCIYTMTPDEHFIVDEEDGLIVMAGFSGHGFKFASVMGEIAKELALQGKTMHPIDFLRFRW